MIVLLVGFAAHIEPRTSLQILNFFFLLQNRLLEIENDEKLFGK